MAKKFAPRVSKKNRKKISVDKNKYKISDEKLLEGAKLAEINLVDIIVKEQVRTKFNESSLKELASNIESNGLIQPLVLHRKGTKYTLICGERRFRAMSMLEMEKCPCFVLDHKSEEELMAIQFSENSSREALHYIDRADGILNYQIATNASERKIVSALGISKTEVHRSLMIAKLAKNIKEAAKVHNIEKYVLLEYQALSSGKLKKALERKIVDGLLIKRSEIKRAIKAGGVLKTVKRKSSPKVPTGLTANAFLKAMEEKTKHMDLDKNTLKALKSLVEETKDLVDQ